MPIASQPHVRRRVTLRRFSKLFVAAVIIVVAASALMASIASADPTFPVMNAEGGIYWRSAPDWGTPIVEPDSGVFEGTTIAVQCYQSGSSVPGSEDTMWEQASVVEGPGRGSGWLNEHFVNDGQRIDQPSPGVPPCGGGSNQGSAPAAQVSCYGNYCSGKDPRQTGCSAGAETLAAKELTGARLELRWSSRCKTEWARWIQYSGVSADTPTELFAIQDTGYTQSASYGVNGEPENPAASSTSNGITTSWTPMIYSPVHLVRAVADIQCGGDSLWAAAGDCALNGRVQTAAR
jgi:Protein of unknown function (DUF2690)